MNQSQENGFDRWDRRIGMLFSRMIGTLSGFFGLYVATRTFGQDDFSLAGYWPALVLIAALFVLTIHCWRSRESMLTMLSDGDRHNSHSKA